MSAQETFLTIGQIAKRANIGIETIRFYERNGLIPEPPRKASGYRQYPQSAVSRIRFIKQAKELGFTLKEIKELLSLRGGSRARCADVKQKAEGKVSEVEAKIRDLQRIRRALKKLSAQCKGTGPISECPILENLES